MSSGGLLKGMKEPGVCARQSGVGRGLRARYFLSEAGIGMPQRAAFFIMIYRACDFSVSAVGGQGEATAVVHVLRSSRLSHAVLLTLLLHRGTLHRAIPRAYIYGSASRDGSGANSQAVCSLSGRCP